MEASCQQICRSGLWSRTGRLCGWCCLQILRPPTMSRLSLTDTSQTRRQSRARAACHRRHCPRRPQRRVLRLRPRQRRCRQRLPALWKSPHLPRVCRDPPLAAQRPQLRPLRPLPVWLLLLPMGPCLRAPRQLPWLTGLWPHRARSEANLALCRRLRRDQECRRQELQKLFLAHRHLRREGERVWNAPVCS